MRRALAHKNLWERTPRSLRAILSLFMSAVPTGRLLLGLIVIGRGARVGADAVVLHDVPAGATVVGIPAE